MSALFVFLLFAGLSVHLTAAENPAPLSIDFGITEKPAEPRILKHFTLFWLCVIATVVLLILGACAVACFFDLKNRSHKLPTEGERSRRRGRRTKQKSPYEPEKKPSAATSTALITQSATALPAKSSQIKSKRPTMVEKRRRVEQAAIAYSEASSASREQEDATQQETPKPPSQEAVVVAAKAGGSKDPPTPVDATQPSLNKSSKMKSADTAKTPLVVNATQAETPAAAGTSSTTSTSCSCSHPSDSARHRAKKTHKSHATSQAQQGDK
ncbi:hypothetical protein M3Y99_01230200 [Aphelenchoides fujianensis]|nr:hypothetical protein M3Y99_01230200 [Aphelenchoides fujianensis]